MFAPEQSLVQTRCERLRSDLAKRKLCADYEGDSRLVDRMDKACAGNHHRSDVAAVAARNGDDSWSVVHASYRTDKSLARDDVRIALFVTQDEPVGLVRDHVQIAVSQNVDVRIGGRFALALQLHQRGVDQDRQ